MGRDRQAKLGGRSGPTSAGHGGQGLPRAADVGVALQGERRDRIGGLLLAGIDQGAHREPRDILVLAVSFHLREGGGITYPSIIILVEHPHQRACSKRQLVFHGRVEVHLHAINVGWTRAAETGHPSSSHGRGCN